MFSLIRKLFGKQEHPIFADADQASQGEFVYVKIPEALMPLDRGDKYEDPLHEILEAKNAGATTGGGSSLGDERADGTRPIEFVGIDLDLFDLESGLPVLREALIELAVPADTEIHYTRGDSKLLDRFTGGSWELAQERTFLHPGFGL